MIPTAPNSSHESRPLSVWILLGLLGVLGVTALAGGAQFVLVPSGAVVGLSTSELSGSPFADYFVPGVILCTVLGALPIAVVYGLYRGHRLAWLGALLVGVALSVWVVVEGSVIGYGRRMQYPHSLQAVAILALSVLDSTRNYCRTE